MIYYHKVMVISLNFLKYYFFVFRVQGVRVRWGSNVGSDHYLLKTKFKIKM